MTQPYTLFVPGRLCLSGEHSDWAGSYRTINPTITPGLALTVCFQYQGLYASIEKSLQSLSLSSTQFGQTTITIASLRTHALSTSPWRYASGVAHILHTRHNPNGSISLTITQSTLPAGKGFSSSAALSVLVARAYSYIYNLNLSLTEEMELAYAGERLTGSACGRMDQVVAHVPGTVACMHFDGEMVASEVVKVGAQENVLVYLVVADLGGRKDTVEILRSLQKGFAGGGEHADRRLVQTLGETNKSIVTEMRMALEKGDAQKLGKLMIQAQQCFDEAAIPLCPLQLMAPKLHQVLKDEQIQPLVYGGKGGKLVHLFQW